MIITTYSPSLQLLIPHHRFTLHTNIFARALLYGPGRILTNVWLKLSLTHISHICVAKMCWVFFLSRISA